MASDILSDQRLRDLLQYDPETGVFTWVADTGRWGRIKAGTRAGSHNNDGYVAIQIGGKKYCAHRLAWYLMTGAWPTDEIDHINGIRADNSWVNLREASRSFNAQNQRRPTQYNQNGFLGVSFSKCRKKWQAAITTNGKTCWLGYFNTPEDAHASYLEAKREQHPGCTI
jgi:hypothetical protein